MEIVILGNGGFARELLGTIIRAGHQVSAFVDRKEGENIYQIPVKTIDTLEKSYNFVLAVGRPDLKIKLLKEVYDKFGKDIKFPVIMDPSAIVQMKNFVYFGKGCVVCAGSILTTNIVIKNYVHINLNCTIGHDCIIDDFCQFSPGVNISGNNVIGKNVYFGTNSSTVENINICDNVIIGAGAVVAKSINIPGTYVGVPAKIKK